MTTTSGNLFHSAIAAATLMLSINSATADVLQWDGSNTSNSQADGGAGTWDAGTTANWWNGASDVVWPNTGTDNDVLFGNLAGTVSLTNVTANDLVFETNGYILSGAATLTLNGSNPSITTAPGVTATIGNNTATVIDGTGGLTKLDLGTLVLNGSAVHSFTGGLKVNGGTLTLDSSNLATPTNLISSSNTLSLSGGTLSVRGKATGTTAQTFNGSAFNSGTSTILVNRNAGTSTTLTLGTVTRGEAGAVGVFNLGAGAMSSAGVSTVEKIMVSNPTGRWLGSWAFNVDPTLATSRWIYVDATGQLRVNTGTTATATTMGNLISDTTVYTASGAFTLGADQIAMGVQSTTNSTYTLGSRVLTTDGLLSITTATTMTINGSGGIRVGAGNQLVTAGAGNITISSPILNKSGDTSHVTHAGGGVLLLTGISSHTGQTTVNSGKITVGTGGNINTTSSIRVNGGAFVQTNAAAAVTPTVTLMAGGVDGTATINTVNVTNNAANFVTNGNGGTGALTIGNLTFSGAGSININSAGSSGLTVTNTLTTTPANGKVTLNVTTAPTWVSGNTYNLLGYGSWTGALSDFVQGSVAGLGARQSAALGTTGSSNGFITLAISSDKVVWTGATSGEWKTAAVGSPFNWKTQTGATDTEFITADDVIFDDTGAITAIDISAANVSPNSILFNNSTKDYTISSTGGFGIGSGVLTKSGSGTVTLNTINTNTGVTTINGGTLKLNNGNALTGVVSLANTAGATLNIAVSETIAAISGGGTTGGAVTIDAGQTITVSSGTQTFNGNVSGSGSFNVAGAFQTINGEVSHSGDVTVSSGRLFLSNANNSYAGTTTIAPGAGLVVLANNALGGTTNGTTITGAGLSAGGVLGLSGGMNYTAMEKISGSGIANTVASFGPFTSVQRGFIQSISGNNTFAGDIEINATGLSRIGVQNGAQLTLSGAITMASGVTGVSILFRAGDNDGDFITLANSGNSWDSDSQLFTFNNGTGAGVKLGANNALPTAYSIVANTGGGTGASFDLAGFDQTLNGLSNSAGTLKIVNSSSTLSTLTLNTLSDKDAVGTVIQDGSGSGKVALVKTGAFSQTLQGANSYSGGTFIKEGRLNLSAGDDRLPTAGSVVLGDTATTGKLVIGTAAVARSQNLAGLTTTGLGGSVVGAHPSNNSTLILSIASGTNTFAGNLGGAGTNEDQLTLIKNGVGTLELTNANSYTGTTVVNTGRLLANNTSGSATGSGTITVNGTAIFGGTGAVSGVVTTTTNSILSPGASIESLTIGGAGGDGTLFIEYDMASIDLLAVTNTLDITTMKLDFSGTAITPAPAYIFATYGSLSGTTFAAVSNVPSGYNVDYAFGGNNIALVAVPEPGTLAMLGGLFLCRVIRRRR